MEYEVIVESQPGRVLKVLALEDGVRVMKIFPLVGWKTDGGNGSEPYREPVIITGEGVESVKDFQKRYPGEIYSWVVLNEWQIAEGEN